MKSIAISVFLLLSLTCTVFARDCKDQLVDGAKPVFTSSHYNKKVQFLCFSEMAIFHSGFTRTPLLSAALLTSKRIADGRAMSREDNFHEEEMLPPDDRATLQDYRGSMERNIQRGHMVANKDTGDRQSQYESFSLSNIIPQDV